jgi:hypothetical protein
VKVKLDNQAPSVQDPEITPTLPYTDDDLVLTFGYYDPENDPEFPDMVKWYKDGIHQATLDNLTTVASSNTNKGELWEAKIWVSDGATYSDYKFSNKLKILNTKPTTSNVQISPSSPSSTTDLSVTYTYSDTDNDIEANSFIEWYVDQGSGFISASLSGKTLSWSATKKGETWKVLITPNDGEDTGTGVWSNELSIGNSKPEAFTLEIMPENPTGLDDLSLSYEFFDIDEDTEVTGTYKWLVERGSGFVDAEISVATVPYTATQKGEIWSCEFTPFDGVAYGDMVTPEENMTIGNTPPEVSGAVLVTPAEPASNNNLGVAYTFDDHDGDTEGSTTFRWYVDMDGDGTFVYSGIGHNEVHSSKLVKGSKWYCEVTPHDGEDFGIVTKSNTVTIGNSPPSVSDLEITPEDPIGGEPLNVKYDYLDIDLDTETGTKIRWYRDDVLLSEYNDLRTIPENVTKKGEVWHFSVQPFDGADYGPTQQSPDTKISNNVIIGNSRPEITNISITPTKPTNADTLVAYYDYFDADDDDVSEIEIRWYRNSIHFIDDKATIEPDYTRRGDIWYFKIRIFDGSDWSDWETSPPNSIINVPPELIITPDEGNYTIYETEVFEFTAKTADKDGDVLSHFWYVNDDPKSVDLSYTLTTDYDSEPFYNVRIEVSDGTVVLSKQWNITVINKDRAPYYKMKDPEINDPKITVGEPFDFLVNVDDPDEEDKNSLTITWYLQDQQVGTGEKYTFVPKDYEVGKQEIKAIVSDGTINTTTSWNVTVEKVKDDREELFGQSYDFWGLVFAIISGIAAVIVFFFGLVRLRKKKGKLQEYMGKIEEITDSDKKPKAKEKELLHLKSQIKKEFSKELITENHYLILEREMESALGDTRKSIIGGKVSMSDKVKEDVDDILDDGVVTKGEYNALMKKINSSGDMTDSEKQQLRKQMTRWMKENKEPDSESMEMEEED